MELADSYRYQLDDHVERLLPGFSTNSRSRPDAVDRVMRQRTTQSVVLQAPQRRFRRSKQPQSARLALQQHSMPYHGFMTDPGTVSTLSLLDLATNTELPAGAPEAAVEVPDSYLSDERFELPGIEGLAIQRLLTLAQRHATLKFVWAGVAARQVLRAPAIYPLAAVALGLTNATHICLDEKVGSAGSFKSARQALLAHRLGTDMFSERQILLCLDHQSPSLPFDLYEPSTQRLRRDDEFESFVDDLLFAQRVAGFSAKVLSKFRLPLAVILRELIENTDDHAKTNFDGSVLKPNAMRGLVIKRILEKRRLPTKRAVDEPSLPCLEFTIFERA